MRNENGNTFSHKYIELGDQQQQQLFVVLTSPKLSKFSDIYRLKH